MKKLIISKNITFRDTISLNKYLNEISHTKVLTIEEELELVKRVSSGDTIARDELVIRNLRFVVSVGKQLVNADILLEDLINEGNIGLIIAANKFKPQMGFRFISYAIWWIRKNMFEHISKNGKIIMLPANKIAGLSKLNKKNRDLEQKLCRKPDITEIIDEYGDEFSDDINELNRLKNTNFLSLDYENVNNSSKYDDFSTLKDYISDDSVEPTDYLIAPINYTSELNHIINTLKPKDKRVIIAIYGLDGSTPMGFKEIGEELNISCETVRLIKVRVLLILKNRLTKLF